MQPKILPLACSCLLVLSACANMTREEQIAAGAFAGAAFGAITAKALELDDEWVILGALGGAAAGTLVARNNATGRCAYSRGDGTYYTAPCR